MTATTHSQIPGPHGAGVFHGREAPIGMTMPVWPAGAPGGAAIERNSPSWCHGSAGAGTGLRGQIRGKPALEQGRGRGQHAFGVPENGVHTGFSKTKRPGCLVPVSPFKVTDPYLCRRSSLHRFPGSSSDRRHGGAVVPPTEQGDGSCLLAFSGPERVVLVTATLCRPHVPGFSGQGLGYRCLENRSRTSCPCFRLAIPRGPQGWTGTGAGRRSAFSHRCRVPGEGGRR